MSVTQDKDIHRNAAVARETITLHRNAVAASQADVKIESFRPGYAFEIVEVQHFADGVTATASYMVKIGTTAALAAATVPTADTRGSATLHATAANRKGSETAEINLHATTNGSGALAALSVRVTIKPQGLRHGGV